MQRYEFQVVPAPRRGEKARGVKTTEERFALALTTLMNKMGAEGWDYVRADTLPVDERAGLTGTKTSFHNMLVFRRVIGAAAEPAQPVVAATHAPAPVLKAEPAETVVPAVKLGAADAPAGPAPSLGPAKHDLAAE